VPRYQFVLALVTPFFRESCTRKNEGVTTSIIDTINWCDALIRRVWLV
jgi:hypothetical protein